MTAAVFSTENSAPPQIHYLFHQYRTTGRKPRTELWHVHHFWQLELILDGCGGELAAETEVLPFTSGDIFLIPSGIRHVFHYPDRRCKWLSVKFSVEPQCRTGAQRFSLNEILEPARTILLHLLNAGRLPDRQEVHLINAVLMIFVNYHLSHGSDCSQPESTFVSRISEYVLSREGKYISVDDVARFIGYSPKYTSNRFRREAGLPLKTFLDRQRYEHAVRRLCFTSDSISTIAAALGFSDTYAFSRFFKHAAGKSPSQFRESYLHSM